MFAEDGVNTSIVHIPVNQAEGLLFTVSCYGLCFALGFATGPGGLTCCYNGIPLTQAISDI
ncbi:MULTISPECIES: hypothetical protein [Oceanobacillus]|uniref:Uncharacterized protein n=1 Tax=Oceanobacillus kimchii TaxID=746691 RepID=A0ABQ5TN95_9BACI|nr:hypothetical protein [Oceanobacillus kimchii]GLO68286.1 hypothetical protein MACH08_40700 [Oceanobacillus kimchii]